MPTAREAQFASEARAKETLCSRESSIRGHACKSPNDPKLSDRGVRRGTCMVGGKAAAEAGAVTHGAVRCSAWLGDFGCVMGEVKIPAVTGETKHRSAEGIERPKGWTGENGNE